MLLKYPFLTVILNKKTKEEVVCVVQIVSKQYISFYNVDKLLPMDRQRFARLADQWWKNEPSLPISLYYPRMFDQFNYTKEFLETSEYTIEQGFQGVSLKNLAEKRIKRKVIHLD
jgi:hypothetical protein